MATQELDVLDSDWERPDRVDRRLWIAMGASPFAWLAHLIGLPVLIAAALITAAGVVALVHLRRLQDDPGRSRRTWLLAQFGLAVAAIAQLLVLVTEALR